MGGLKRPYLKMDLLHANKCTTHLGKKSIIP